MEEAFTEPWARSRGWMLAKLSTKPQAHAWEASQRLDGYKLPAHKATIRNVSEVSPVPTGDEQGAPDHTEG